MEILGIIPARGGSKSIPHKNLAPLGGRPLLTYTCSAAVESRRLTRTILSTDDPAIAAVGKSCGIEVPFMRPREIAEDDTPMLQVLRHALETLDKEEGYRPQLVTLLQPTSPFRRAEHVDAAIDLMLSTDADTVVTVVEVPHRFIPVSLMRVERDRLVRYFDGPLILRRQDKPKVYARNGPAVLVVRREVLFLKNDLYGDSCYPLEMNPEDSIDIDTKLDLEFAEFLLQRRGLPR